MPLTIPTTRRKLTRDEKDTYSGLLSLDLSPSERLLVHLIYRDRMSLPEAADLLGVTETRGVELMESLTARLDARRRQRKNEMRLACTVRRAQRERQRAQQPAAHQEASRV